MEDSIFKENLKVVQKNTPYYDLKWGSVQNPAKQNTWNWAAFFFFIFWLAYRKMYKPFFVIGILIALWEVPFYFFDITIWVDVPYYFGILFATGWFGNRWYYNHTNQVLNRAKALSESHHDLYLHTKGGTHIGTMLGLIALLIAVLFASGLGLSYLPTETNIKDVVRMSGEGTTLEVFTDDPAWKYVKKEGRSHFVEFTGYDYAEEENVRIIFRVYLDKQLYEWKDVYINDKKLNKEEAEEYQLWIEDNTWF